MSNVVEYRPGTDLQRLMFTNKSLATTFKKIIAKELRNARKEVSENVHQVLTNDPRDAYKAVKLAVYKTVFGGSISILEKKKATNTRCRVTKTRKLREGQRGGNRMKRSERTERIDSYYGSDRGFILRFLNSGASRAKRGTIDAKDFFLEASEGVVEKMAEEITKKIEKEIDKIIKKNG